MRRFASLFAVFLTLVAPLLVPLASSPAHADSYTIYHLGNGNSEENIGLTSTGVAVLYGADNCASPNYCYSTYTNGALTNVSLTNPGLTLDNGSPCSPSLPGGYTAGPASMCNGSYAGVQAQPSVGDPSLYGGKIGMLGYVATFPVGDIKVDSLGDILWLNPDFEENFEAIDLTSRISPEPSSLILLGTGALGVVGALRRRVRKA